MSTMTQPAALWTDANREEIDAENRMACDDARAEWEHNEAIRDTCAMASDFLCALLADSMVTHPLLKERRAAELEAEFARYRETLELMTGETWPEKLGPFLGKCDRLGRAHEEMAA